VTPSADRRARLEAVLFDMDGVQVDSEPLHTLSFTRLMAECGVEVPPDVDSAFRGHDDREIFAELRDRLGLPGEVHALIARRTRLFLDALEAASLEPMPGLLPLFDALRDGGIPFALGSSSVAEIVDAILRKLGTRDRFAAIVTASDVRRCKPHPDVWLEAARRVGADPRGCVVIEDARSGIEAARAAGARTVLLRDPGYREASEIRADLVVDSLSELDVTALERVIVRS
jgi:HAD superfamily hydrolase (TIGR01509 family)